MSARTEEFEDGGRMNHFYELWEHYIPDSKAQRPSLNYLRTAEREQELINGQLPRSHGYSYLLTRSIMEGLGDEMGINFLLNHPELNYKQCVEATRCLE